MSRKGRTLQTRFANVGGDDVHDFNTTFTVFTATHNRANTLVRVRDSLDVQTFRDFEWIVVDDGSTDDTRQHVERWQQDASFPIRYFFQENSGKHVAFNRAVRHARGALFLNLDSDDECAPEALERLHDWWQAIPEPERDDFSAVTTLCRDQTGALLGTRFPESPLDCTSIEMRWKHKVKGEKWGFHRTDVLRQHPFPEPEGVKFVSESIVWRAIDKRFKTRFVNEVLRTYWVGETGKPNLSTITPGVLEGRVMFHAQTLNDLTEWFPVNPTAFVAAAVNLTRYRIQQGKRVGEILATVQGPWIKLLVALSLPVGAVVALRDQRRRRSEASA